MKCASRLLLAFALAVSACWGASTASAATYTGVVTAVRDGDTVQLTTDDGKRLEVRLNGIDAPEKGRAGRPGQPFADKSAAALRALAWHRRAALETTKRDVYGRAVGLLTVETPQGQRDAGQAQLAAGLAWVFTRYIRELPPALQNDYAAAEHAARSAQLGLWRQPVPTPPWTWRARAPAPTGRPSTSPPRGSAPHPGIFRQP